MVAPPTQPAIDGLLRDWRIRVSRRLLAIMVGLSSVLVLLFVNSLTPASTLASGLILAVCAGLAFWKGAPQWMRSAVILTVFAYSGVIAIYSGHDPGAATLYLSTGVALAAVLVGTRWGAALLGVAAAILLIGAWALSTGTSLLTPAPEVLSPAMMLVGDTVSFVALGVLVLTSLDSLLQRLRQSLVEREVAVRELEHQNAERERAFAELQSAHATLRAAQTSLVKAGKLELLGQLAGGIAHDMNNALTVILGEAGLLSDRAPDQAEAIADAVEHASNLTRQLLAVGRRDVVQPRAIELGSTVERSATMLRRALPSNIEVQLSLAPGVVVRADPNQIQQIVLNLGTNAGHALSEGGSLSIRVTRAGDCARLEVEDDGVGMDAETRAHIFEPFFTTKPDGVGTGLGLPSVRAIVETLAGEIRCESRAGVGTHFVIELPILAELPDPALGSTRSTSPATRLDGYRILVADDEVRVRAMVTTILQAAGASVVDVGHADAAIALSEREPKPFDLLWTDVVMPGGGGGTLVTHFAEHSPTTRIVVSTGYSDDDVLRQDVALGRYELLRKPFAPNELTRVVARALQDKRPNP